MVFDNRANTPLAVESLTQPMQRIAQFGSLFETLFLDRGFLAILDLFDVILALAQIRRGLGDESGARIWEQRAEQLGP